MNTNAHIVSILVHVTKRKSGAFLYFILSVLWKYRRLIIRLVLDIARELHKWL